MPGQHLIMHLKVTRNPRENATQGGTNIFTNTLVRHQIA